MKKSFSIFLVLCMLFSFSMSAFAASEEASGEASGDSAVASAESIAADPDVTLKIENPAWELSADGSYYSLKNVQYCTNVVSDTYQFMNIYVPAAYIDGGECNGYTADTAPVVLNNDCMGWQSSTPSSANTDYLGEGFVYISCGARSRGAGENGEGKSPSACVDQKAAVRTLRLNEDVIPGDMNKIISIGSSGGGQMSSILGATGNMAAYYPYLYEMGAAGISKDDAGNYISTINDDIFASMCFCPIADLNNADLAYAWFRFDAGETSAATMFSGTIEFSEFQLELQNDLALAYCEYINDLGIKDEEGNVLTFDKDADGVLNPRSGSYYEKILSNISDALNAWIAETFSGEAVVAESSDASGEASSASGEVSYATWEEYYTTLSEPEKWLSQNADGSWAVTDLAGFLNGTGLARNKDIPGFDTLTASEEGNAFGGADNNGYHFSASVAAVLEANKDKYSKMEGYDAENVEKYIEQARDESIANQAYLMNATQIMLNVAAGTEEADPAEHWRTRNGTADEHTSFNIAYNLCMSALACGCDVDYSLVWNMAHGSNEGSSTGTFAEWVHSICKDAGEASSEEPAVSEETAAVSVAGDLSDGGWPLSGKGDTSMDAYKAYMKAYMDCVPEMDGHEEELYGLIDAEDFSNPPVCMAYEDQFAENAMSYDEFVAANGEYSLALFGLTNPANGDPT